VQATSALLQAIRHPDLFSWSICSAFASAPAFLYMGNHLRKIAKWHQYSHDNNDKRDLQLQRLLHRIYLVSPPWLVLESVSPLYAWPDWCPDWCPGHCIHRRDAIGCTLIIFEVYTVKTELILELSSRTPTRSTHKNGTADSNASICLWSYREN
jgi:hypothetical protein